ncbi:MAG: HIT family protein [Erysipelotrichaceae bacterium]|nr:HIT family protein [Erysipelotrichaceae bacterium]
MCLFCEIINGNIPSSKVYEDDEYLAILDIAQTTRGHTLVMPKKHYDTFLDMPKEEFEKLMGKTQEVARVVLEKLNASGCNILINTNEVAGQTIMHVHAHIIPRYDANDTVTFQFTENKLDLNEVLNDITKAE